MDATPKVFDSEYRFCLLLWEHEPVKSSELAKLCADQLGWKKSTTYTVIKRLAERGVVQTENAVVRSLISKEEIQCAESHEIVDKTFEGSLPAFIAAFTRNKPLSREEADEIRRMINAYGED